MKTSLIFTIPDEVGALEKVLAEIKNCKLSMAKIESRPSKTEASDYDIFVDFANAEDEAIATLLKSLKSHGIGVGHPLYGSMKGTRSFDNLAPHQTLLNVPWFPRKMGDLDEFCNRTLQYGTELAADHPGFTDEAYRKRRVEIAKIASQYKCGEKIPRIDYTKEELQTWNAVWNNITKLYPTHACKQFNYIFPLLVQNCGYGPNSIPQLEDVSRFLQECTGFRLRPVTGLLSSRDFLNGLAFRVFHSTQYIRHHSVPLYTPEPDVCHELLGHVPLFADPDFAEFSQEIGLASLGASDEEIEKLATCYWFTIEFGLCQEDGKMKAYGAGLLSSFGELKYCLGEDEKRKPKYVPFNPAETAVTKYPITDYQPVYFVADSFQSAKEKLVQYAHSQNRPFSVKYNPYTQGVEILDTKPKLTQFVKEIQTQLSVLTSALSKLPIQD